MNTRRMLQCLEVERRYGESLIARQVLAARAANVTAIAFAKRGLRQAAKQWYRRAHAELRLARILRSV